MNSMSCFVFMCAFWGCDCLTPLSEICVRSRRTTHRHVAWQVQHFKRVLLRVFCQLHLSGLRQVVTTCHLMRVSRCLAEAVLHSTLETFTLSTLHFPFPLHTPHFTLHTVHSPLCTPHSTLHTPHATLYTLDFPPRTLHCTLHTPHFTFYTQPSPLNTPLFFRTPLRSASFRIFCIPQCVYLHWYSNRRCKCARLFK